MEFKEIELTDSEKIREHLKLHPSKQLINCFESFFLWKNILNIKYSEVNGSLFFKITTGSDSHFFFPVGYCDIKVAIDYLKSYLLQKNNFVKLYKVTGEQIRLLEQSGFNISAISVRDNAEYIYLADSFRTYKGKHLQSKRNFVNYAKKNYNWEFSKIAKENIPDCLHFVSLFSGDSSFEGDNEALVSALSNYDRLHLDGGIIYVDGQISALLITSLLADGKTAAGLFLRGDHDKKGIITLLYQEFFKEYTVYYYVNLAEDLGLEGLRKNKLSYSPYELLELYDVVIF